VLQTQLEVAVAGPEHQTTSSLFIFGLLQKWYFLLLLLALVFCHWRQCHWLCQVTRFAACPAIVAHVTCGVPVTTALFFSIFLLLPLVVVVCEIGCAD
jgi:hypothetical protein